MSVKVSEDRIKVNLNQRIFNELVSNVFHLDSSFVAGREYRCLATFCIEARNRSYLRRRQRCRIAGSGRYPRRHTVEHALVFRNHISRRAAARDLTAPHQENTIAETLNCTQ